MTDKGMSGAASARPARPADTMGPAVLSGVGLMTRRLSAWKSPISWRMTLTIFLTLMALQAAMMVWGVSLFEKTRIAALVDSGRTAIAAIMPDNETAALSSYFGPSSQQRLLTETPIRGVALFNRSHALIGMAGDPVFMVMKPSSTVAHAGPVRSRDGLFYEALLTPADLGAPFSALVKLDAVSAARDIHAYILHKILVMIVISVTVTLVLMMGLSTWLLEPILYLRESLVRASSNPDDIQDIPARFQTQDEMGGAIRIAHELIEKNASHLRSVKVSAQDQIHKLAYYDTLTDLPNRTLFIKQFHDFTRSQPYDSPPRIAVVVFDIDNFRDINDSMGHNVGDAILKAIAKRLRSSMPESAIVSRTGEDEFAIFMPLANSDQTAMDVGRRVQGIIRSHPLKIFNEDFQIRISIGVATYPDNSANPDQILKCSDIALNRAKEDGRDTIREYAKDFDGVVRRRFQMLRDLRTALEEKQLSLHFQPQVDLSTGDIIGAEALIRWWFPDQSPEGGTFISPAHFIPVAEQSGLIIPIGEWVLREACTKAKEWCDQGMPIRVAVNVSGNQFHQSDLPVYVESTLKETGLRPELLELELTESSFMQDVDETVEILQKLSALGVEIAIDDFGTGYSSLSYLRQFPIDRLKIDQSFIRNALNNENDASIARTIIRLGHSLGLKVIAEGVETEDHEKFLFAEGCDEVQGYRYSRPVPNDKLVAFLKEYKGQYKRDR